MDRICPYLALASDHRSVIDGYDPDHRCHALAPPGELDRQRQATICLLEAHRECERFLEARHLAAAGLPAVPRPAPDAFLPRTRLVLEAEGRHRLGGEAFRPGRRRRWALAGALAALGVTVVASAASGGIDAVLGGGSGSSPTATATPIPSAAGTPSPSSAPTTAPTAAPTPVPTAVATALPTPVPTPTVAPAQQTYVVAANDTLTSIAARFGVTVQALMAANNLADPNALSIGQVLVIP